MARPQSRFICQRCAESFLKWEGQCRACGEWNSLVETIVREPTRAERIGAGGLSGTAQPTGLAQIAEADLPRLSLGIAELDRVLGGGLVPGSLVLLGGEPGIGKSTLLLQAAAGLARSETGSSGVLYASGEESPGQIRLRATRLGVLAGVSGERIQVLAEHDVSRIAEVARDTRPALVVVDSIQTATVDELDGAAGSVGQVRESALRLMDLAKGDGIAVILVGHVTKDGSIAGPKTLEHLVDVVLQFEGDGGSPYRILRGHKNRFGSTQELGVFEMRGAGLAEVENPSALLLAERPIGAPGSVVVAAGDGQRPLLVEVQALVAPAAAGVGRRTAAGVDGNRVALLLAVLAQRAACDVLHDDVFVNVAGGMRLVEPAADLGIACAIASSARGRAVDAKTVVFGELGLAGEVRAVPMVEARIAEARRLGFTRCLLPAQNAARLAGDVGLELVPVDRLSTALSLL
jgi:DNA repair protein RadA/Sms